MRSKQPKRREPVVDPRYGSLVLNKFINMVMLDGKKDLARDLVYSSLEKAGQKVSAEPLEVFEKALANVEPAIEVRSRRVGGANFQVPTPVPNNRKQMLAMRWIISAARSRSGRDFVTLLSNELIAAYNGEGDAIKTRENVHKMAEANRAFAHFRW
ncbi:30S ribosomal protein S7 [candidate division WWE3 bacterium]|uniref:Small ribosomal subunit protein uS7 n=1 Tax=candidate division WWE3 bacterium TaxID=2053526 RepID=A0A955LVC2_UNCKA|nr:30S ribosomal protein S7 [candidate division WWE3 bacterium]